MQPITFITGNQKKADYLAKYLGFPVWHQKVNLDELQSLSLREIVEHKVKQAYDIIKMPVLVEDVSLEFSALWRLPWPFIKFFIEEMPFENICSLLDGKDRSAVARCMFWYYDGEILEFFEWNVLWSISNLPRWNGGFWWDRLFIPHWIDKTAAELSIEEYERFYTEAKPFDQIRDFLAKQ